MIKINIAGSLAVEEFIKQYHVWIDYQNFYYGPKETLIQMNPDGWPCAFYSDTQTINDYDSKIIIIDCVTEGIHSKDYFNQYRTDRKYLIISNGWWNQEYHSFDFDYELIHYPYFLLDINNTYSNPYKFNFYLDKTYRFDYPKSCRFVSTIGNVRPERSYLVDQITSKIPSTEYILRYSGENFGIPCDIDVIDFVKGEFDPYLSKVPQHYHSVSQSLPIELYNQGYFNLVVETDIDLQAEFFLTEKTVKCLATGMPFVVVSTPGFLQHLKNWGFLTYQDLWDESYDQERDFKCRIKHIVDLCRWLGNFDWAGNREALETIGLKNQQNFSRINRIADKVFADFENALGSLALSQ